jgi:hypothetical protein
LWWQEGETTFHFQNNTTSHQQLGGWQFTYPMHYFPHVDVPSPRYGQIYNILLDDQKYDVTIGNFLGCSYVYFVKMLVGSLGARGVYVHCNMCIMSSR